MTSSIESTGQGRLVAPGRTVLLAPDKFKGSATAAEVAAALAQGLVPAQARVVRCPIADGGDGTVDALLATGAVPVRVPTVDAVGRAREATVAVRGATAFVELADVCGLATLAEPSALGSGTFGLGLVLRYLLDAGFGEITVGLGGSASTDGGLGLLVGLGARAFDAQDRSVPPTGDGLLDVVHLDLDGLAIPDGVRLKVASDVDVPLTGPDGAAVLFGPQKGASPDQVRALDEALVRWGRLLAEATGRSVAHVRGAGAAGGAGAALLALGANLVPGADEVLAEVGFDDALASADLVVTGEGRWDKGSLRGKGPGEVVRRAVAAGVPVVLVVGQIEMDAPVPEGVVRVVCLVDLAADPGEALTRPLDVLGRAAEVVARL